MDFSTKKMRDLVTYNSRGTARDTQLTPDMTAFRMHARDARARVRRQTWSKINSVSLALSS